MGGRGGSSHRSGSGARDPSMPLSLQFFAGKEAKYIQDVTRRYHLSASDLAYMHGQLEKIISENDLAMRVRREYQFTPDDVLDYYPVDRLMHDIALALMAVQTQTTEILDEFPTKAARTETAPQPEEIPQS